MNDDAAPARSAGLLPRRIGGRLSFPFREFFEAEAAGGILLLAAAFVAIIWANSPWRAGYDALWATPLSFGLGDWTLTKTLHHWVNDGLMAVFFFVVGLEIKREVLVGELASPRQAALPVAAAAGGAIAPAVIYLALNGGTPAAAGWGVPMATDIAFALGILALLGDRVPAGLKIFLAALAIVDDLLAVAIIALFYTTAIAWGSLGLAAAALAALVVANRLHVRQPAVYALVGVVLWFAVLRSGVHATVAGVLLALTIPARTRIDPAAFVARGRRLLAEFAAADAPDHQPLPTGARQEAIEELKAACEDVDAPLQRLEHALHPWVAFGIVPIFALANAGVPLAGGFDALANRVTLGVVLGLVVGKQLGILAAAAIAMRLGLAALPSGVGWRHIHGAGWLAGIGFTMSLFIADLAFGTSPALTSAKLGILVASVVAGVAGLLWLRGAGDGAGVAGDGAAG